MIVTCVAKQFPIFAIQKERKLHFYRVECATLDLVGLSVCADENRSLVFPSLLSRVSFSFSPTFRSNPWVAFQNKGVCWRASLHAVLCHQTANGEGAHRLHHWRGALFPQWGQTHPTADWIQDAGESQWFMRGKKDCSHYWIFFSIDMWHVPG